MCVFFYLKSDRRHNIKFRLCLEGSAGLYNTLDCLVILLGNKISFLLSIFLVFLFVTILSYHLSIVWIKGKRGNPACGECLSGYPENVELPGFHQCYLPIETS